MTFRQNIASKVPFIGQGCDEVELAEREQLSQIRADPDRIAPPAGSS